MKLRVLAGLALVGLLGLGTPSVAGDKVSVGPGGGTPATSSKFTLVGANPLAGRGMNAALAIYRRYVYVGNRTDGSNRCGAGDPRGAVDPDSCPHPHPGILVVDTANPANPTVVGEFGRSS